MIVIPIQGIAFDKACDSLRGFGRADKVRELIAKRTIEAAKNGEFDPMRLHSQAILGSNVDDTSMPIVSVGRYLPVPVCVDRAHVVINGARPGDPTRPGFLSCELHRPGRPWGIEKLVDARLFPLGR